MGPQLMLHILAKLPLSVPKDSTGGLHETATTAPSLLNMRTIHVKKTHIETRLLIFVTIREEKQKLIYDRNLFMTTNFKSTQIASMSGAWSTGPVVM